MNIIFDTNNIDQIRNNNILLELDTFYFSELDKTATAYCVVDNVKLTDFGTLDQNQKLHADMIGAYKKKDFKLCQDLLEHLVGTFSGDIDSFYLAIEKRIKDLDSNTLPADWDGIIEK